MLERLMEEDAVSYAFFKRTVAHVLMGLGGDSDKDTDKRIEERGTISDAEAIDAICAVMRQEAFNNRDLQPMDGRLANGMSVMAMGAHTGCNTVFGSTPPNNPHPYPWMNSLFQDGATISWMIGESFMAENSRHSIIPERLADHLFDESNMSEEDYFIYTHFSDAHMTDLEVRELPKVWALGGDGAMGDIGFQNVSKVVLQNRPNVNMLMLDTQVYSNTGGQNSDSSPMTGGFDMNQFGAASQGKLCEMKNVAEAFLGGHGSPFVAQVSMADAPRLYKAMLDGLEYRGTSFYHCFTTCQPEHGVADDMATPQAVRVRDCRGLPEFVFDPTLGESYQEAMSLKGNRQVNRDWMIAKYKESKEKYNYTVAHWCASEGRFRKHLKKVKETEIAELVHLDDLLVRVMQDDVVNRRYLDHGHRAYVPEFGAYILFEDNANKLSYVTLSRQMVLFVIERRKAWRLLQSKAGVENKDYEAQKVLLQKVDSEEIPIEELFKQGRAMLDRIVKGEDPLGAPEEKPEEKPAEAAETSSN